MISERPMIMKNEQAREWLRRNSRHFSAKELECKCGCGSLVIDTDLITKLEQLRVQRGKPVAINSGTRCPAHNAAEGGKTVSEHLSGQAVDIAASTSSDRFELLDLAIRCGFERIGIGKSFVHLGTSRSLPTRVAWLY